MAEVKTRAVALSTVDNPYDPFDDFIEWYAWDVEHGYNSCALLGRVSRELDEVGDTMHDRMIEESIDEIVDLHNGEIYTKIVNNS